MKPEPLIESGTEIHCRKCGLDVAQIEREIFPGDEITIGSFSWFRGPVGSSPGNVWGICYRCDTPWMQKGNVNVKGVWLPKNMLH